MNDFNNNQDNMNDNYNQNYGNNNGEYYCSYTPNRSADKPRKIKRAEKYIFIAIMSVTLVALVVLSGIVIGSLTLTLCSRFKRCEISKVEGDGDSLRVSGADVVSTEKPTGTPPEEEAVKYVTDTVDHGISVLDVTEKNLHCYYKYGIRDVGVIVAHSAYTDELLLGDRIISVNGTEISSSSDIQRALDGCEVGDTVEIVASRSGKEFAVKITVREQIPDYVNFE